MFSWNDLQVEQKMAEERYRDMRRARQLDRLRRSILDDERRPALHSRARHWLGHRLVSWGCDLQDCCDAALRSKACQCRYS
jgi:hypothetical protein